jgi:hypothetical protein
LGTPSNQTPSIVPAPSRGGTLPPSRGPSGTSPLFVRRRLPRIRPGSPPGAGTDKEFPGRSKQGPCPLTNHGANSAPRPCFWELFCLVGQDRGVTVAELAACSGGRDCGWAPRRGCRYRRGREWDAREDEAEVLPPLGRETAGGVWRSMLSPGGAM